VSTLSAVVPATNRPGTLAQCIAGIEAALDRPDEILIVDAPAGAGPAEARNAGVRQAHGDIVVFVDADVVVHPDVFRLIREAFDADPGLAAVFGSYDDDPSAPGIVSGFRNLLHHHVHQRSAGPASTFWAGLGAVRRDVFLAAGGFDAARYPVPSVEDIELGMRMAAAGARLRLEPGVQGTHLKRWTLTGMVRTDFTRRGLPWVALLLRTGRASSALNLGWRHRLSSLACVATLGAVAGRRPVIVASGMLAFVSLNASLYALLLRRRGPATAAAGVALHAVHHLVGVAAVPAGVAAHVRERRRSRA
jgi:Glycosyltransferase like family 2